MQKSRLKEYSYTILLCVSFGLVACLWQFGGLKEQRPEELSHFLQDATDDLFGLLLLEQSVEAVSAEVSGEILGESNLGKETEALPGPGEVRVETMEDDGQGVREEMAEALPSQTMTDAVGDKPEGKTESMPDYMEEEFVPEIFHADVSYFDDALFIGDSRTVGLYEYGGLGNAEVFAHSGMSIYKVFKEEFELRSGEKTTLNQALETKQFGKIYIMLGINELGYDFDQTIGRFSEAIELIRQMQPKALVFIQANLHITNKKSEESDLFNNINIDKFNQAVSQLADGKQIFYMDVNPLYDDENGGLSEEYTSDHAHILGKHYVNWVDFILQNAVKVKQEE